MPPTEASSDTALTWKSEYDSSLSNTICMLNLIGIWLSTVCSRRARYAQYLTGALGRRSLQWCLWMDPGQQCNGKYCLPSGAWLCHCMFLTRFLSCQQSYLWHFGSNIVETIAGREHSEHSEHQRNPWSWRYVTFLDHLRKTIWLYLCGWAWLLVPLPWHLHSLLLACNQNPLCYWGCLLNSNCSSKPSSCLDHRDLE